MLVVALDERERGGGMDFWGGGWVRGIVLRTQLVLMEELASVIYQFLVRE